MESAQQDCSGANRSQRVFKAHAAPLGLCDNLKLMRWARSGPSLTQSICGLRAGDRRC